MTLATRLTLAMAALVILTAAAVGFLIDRNIAARALPRALDRFDKHAQLLAVRLEASVRSASADVSTQGRNVDGLVLASLAGGVHPLDGTTRAFWQQQLAARFRAELAAKPTYSQFRLIGIADQGREIVRVDRTGPEGSIRVVSDAELQPKADRDFFKAAIGLSAGETYASPVDLIQEAAIAEAPRVPTLRVAAPVMAPDKRPFGVMVINVNMRAAFADIRAAGVDGGIIYVVNEQGDYLVHPDPAKEFGFVRGEPLRIQDTFPAFAEALARGDTPTFVVQDRAGERFGVGWDTVRLAGGPKVSVIEAVPYSRILAATTALPSVLGAAFVFLGAIPLVVLLARSLSRPLVQITRAIEGFSQGEPGEIPTGASGEIGVLARAFAGLMNEVREKAAALTREVEEHRRTSDRERLFSAAVESSEDAIVTSTLDGIITGWNPGAERLFGYGAAESIGRGIAMVVPQERKEEVPSILRQIGLGEVIHYYDTVLLRRDGGHIDVSLSICPVRSPSGEIIGAANTARDIADAKLAAADLIDSARMARAIIDTALDAFVQMDHSGRILQWNERAEAIFGWPREKAVGKTLADLIVPERHRMRHREGLARFLRSDESAILGRRIEIEALRRDGSEVKVELSVTALRQRGGWVFNGFIRDLTEKIAAEAQLRQSQKMEAVGQLTGGIAHDFNNMLTVITGTIDILAEAVADRPELAAIAKLMSEAADRGAELTGQLLAFARKQPLQPREVDINALMADSTKLLRRALGEQVDIELRTGKDVWSAMVDPTQLTSALLNLAVNARDAMPNGGKLTLETKNVTLDQAYADTNSEVRPGNYVMIAVSDTGSGIPQAIRDRIFEPFFSTKEVGKGTGLGLSMVYGFLKQSGGHIKVYSEEGHGTTMRLYLPQAVTSAGELAVAAPTGSAIDGGGEVILLVEDDAIVRSSVTAQLQSLGYRTVATANAEEALALVDKGTSFDLLFTDVVMPGKMNGRELAEEVARRRSGVKALFTSGYTEDAVVHHGRLDRGMLLLAKPYRKADLAGMIRKALGAGSAAESRGTARRASN